MMILIMFMILMIPLCFLNKFWLIKNLLVLMSLYFLTKISFFHYSFISYFMGSDFLSYFLVLLSIWILFLMFMASEKIYKLNDYTELFSLFSIMLLMMLVFTFFSLNMFLFYLFFEASLIPVLFLIMGWGYQPERIQAGMYMFFYTIIASLPMLLFIMYFYTNFYSLDFNVSNVDLSSLVMYFMMITVFLVKLPMFMFHLWLPKAHVEASVAGSMVLAGVMLKLGSYGLIRFMNLFLMLGMKVNFFLINLSLLGGIIVSLTCLRQSDLKSLIAYSSVVHMGLLLSGLLTFNIWGITGSLIMMLAHGLCSSGLFVLVNINYERFYSRSIYINKGMLNLIPFMSLWWFLLVTSNMAAPPSLNLLGEIILITSLINYSWLFMYLMILISFFSAVYCLFLYSFSQHGQFYNGIFNFLSINHRELILLFMHWVPLNLILLKSDLFLI
uniref:NADH dehydrogenase subunit 4 n=1 Tax=Illeis koebelei TaxID=420091 RepID=UPI0021823A27|nr:NADH dehydrogenase subunit 4 [Illeis koebelei]UHJ19224.1 NADH dehydrogenase subunit 4 [Illeis koebelei]UVF63305.1 NADH dehydrogenase subunit 4 [Illeis koebelei]